MKGNHKSESFIKALPDLAWEYIDECLNNRKEFATQKGDIVKVSDRHIPTIQYFLRIWLPINYGETISRDTWYRWLRMFGDKSDTIKSIDNLFKSLATDIVANEGKGIFYAKNKLGMTDKQQIEHKTEQQLFGNDVD